MKNLVEESKDILEDAKTTYDQAFDDMESVILTLKSFKNGLKKAKENFREGAYASARGITAGMIIADLFGCLGLCSAIVTPSTWSDVESSIAQLQKTMDENVEDVNDIIKQSKNLQKFIQKETLIIIEWDDEVDRLSGKLHYVKEENFYRLPLKRKSLTNSL